MTARSGGPRRRTLRAAGLGVVVAFLAFGIAACTSDTERLSDRTGETPAAAAADGTESPEAVPPADMADPADPTISTAPETNMTSIPDLPDPSLTAVSTSGPVTSAGDIDQQVPEVPVTLAPPVALTDTADFGGQVTARISEVKAVQATATLPGEISGPAIAVTVDITNGSADRIGADSVTVTLADAAGNPAVPIDDNAAPLTGVVEPGASASGTYVFTVPADQRNPVTVTVNYSAGAPTLVFTGPVAGG